MKKILLPTDFSENAWNAIEYAMNLYKGIKCQFYLLNAYQVSPVKLSTTIKQTNIKGLFAKAKNESTEALQIMMENLKNSKLNSRHTFKIVSKESSLLPAIKNIVKSNSIDIIIMGTKGATGAKGVFMGSNTVRVLKNIKNCPVIVIPEEAEYTTVSEIAFATDFKRTYHSEELKPIITLARENEATLRVIHATLDKTLDHAQSYNSYELERHFKDIRNKFHFIPDHTIIENALNAFIEEIGIQLLAMVYYKRSIIESLINEPVIKKMALRSKIPFLVIPSYTG